MHQLEEVDAFVSDAGNMFLDVIHGIDPLVMYTCDLHVPDFLFSNQLRSFGCARLPGQGDLY
jgi:hypothetical protein